jgi:hypothetical protein
VVLVTADGVDEFGVSLDSALRLTPMGDDWDDIPQTTSGALTCLHTHKLPTEDLVNLSWNTIHWHFLAPLKQSCRFAGASQFVSDAKGAKLDTASPLERNGKHAKLSLVRPCQ